MSTLPSRLPRVQPVDGRRALLRHRDVHRIASFIASGFAYRFVRDVSALTAKLARALVLDEVAPDVVHLGSQVVYADAAGREASAWVVDPWDESPVDRRVNVLAPLGTALLGMRAGASIEWSPRPGHALGLTIVRVG